MTLKAEYLDHMGDDLMVVNAARVSFNKSKDIFDQSDEKLISFLAKHGHWTPFSHPQISLRMIAPISIRTQCFKHKVGFSENEISRRYVDDQPEFFSPLWRKRSESAKQGSSDQFPDPEQLQFKSLYYQICSQSLFIYDRMIKEGVCPEQARFVLPQGMVTQWHWTGSLAAFARFCKQRSDEHAQKEIQELARQVSAIIKPLFPISWKALTKKEPKDE